MGINCQETSLSPSAAARVAFGAARRQSGYCAHSWVAVKELKLSYHNGYVW